MNEKVVKKSIGEGGECINWTWIVTEYVSWSRKRCWNRLWVNNSVHFFPKCSYGLWGRIHSGCGDQNMKGIDFNYLRSLLLKWHCWISLGHTSAGAGFPTISFLFLLPNYYANIYLLSLKTFRCLTSFDATLQFILL